MKGTVVACLAVVGLIAPIYAAPDQTQKITAECLNTHDCKPGFCCMYIPMRYSTPTCVSNRQVGEICRPNNQPVNASLSYPDGTVLDATNVYYAVCPCDSTFTCDRKQGTCINESGHVQGSRTD